MSSRSEQTQPLILSVLDRLLDDDPQVSREAPRSRSQTVADLKRAVRRDLEDLLNTRCRCTGWPPELKELENSLVNYGLPDFSGTHMRAAEDPRQFIALIEGMIRRFEPRLANIRVELIRNAQPLDRTLRFRIDAFLPIDGGSERVAYHSSLETSTGAFQVEGAAK